MKLFTKARDKKLNINRRSGGATLVADTPSYGRI